MINKLYNLIKNQTDQKLIHKASLKRQIDEIDIEVKETQKRIETVSIDKLGAISDFLILGMHKDTMRYHIKELLNAKQKLTLEVESLTEEIIELQKESEQYKYILDEEKKENFKNMLNIQMEESSEYIQSKYIRLKEIS